MGYGLAAFTKPVFPLAPNVGWLIAARFIDRVGKGIRGAPRDALVADISPAHLRGASFGLRQSLDTVGAFLGPLIAIILMWWTADHFTAVFWIAVIPAFLSFGLILFAVREPERPKDLRQVRMPLSRSEISRLGPAYWWVVAVAAVFTLARFSEAFLILRAQSIGLPIMLGAGGDGGDEHRLCAFGLSGRRDLRPRGPDDRACIGPDAARCGRHRARLSPPASAVLAVGVLLWGLHMGFTQGLLAALVADAAPAELRGTAFGMFNLVTGIALLLASVIAGALWDVAGPRGTFLAGAAFTMLTLAGLLPMRHRLRRTTA